jgi:type IV pilus assembly protein PilE
LSEVSNVNTSKPRVAGFTLIELMIVVAVIALLAAIGYPAYQEQAERARRADGKSAVLAAAQALERCRTQFGAYNNASCPDYDPAESSDEGFYAVSLPVITATTFTVTSTAQGVQLGDGECRTMSVDHLGARTATDSGGGDSTAACW